jgi:hypothetical protein
MQYIAIILGLIFVILVTLSDSKQTDIKSVKLEMCKKDAKCSYSPDDIPSYMAREYYQNK